MFIYKVIFGDGSEMNIRASSPKEAVERAEKIGIVKGLRFIR